MQKSLHIDPGKCTGCLQCEAACSLVNQGAINPSTSRIKVFNFHDEGRFVPFDQIDSQCDALGGCPRIAIVTRA